MSTNQLSDKKINMSDVAAASGVSRQVVSYILNGKQAHCSEETKARVLATAEKIGYRRNRAAINFTQNRQGNFDLIMDSFYAGNAQLLSGITQTALKHDQSITLSNPGPDQQARCLHENSCDAVILLANTNSRLDEQLERISTPVVRINCNVQDHIACINYDERQGMDLLLEKIQQRQRRSLLFIHNDGEHFSRQAREQAIYDSIKDNHYDIDVHCVFLNKNSNVERELTNFLQAQAHIDAVIAPERSLPKLYQALRHTNRQVGDDISVLCINAHIVAQAVFPLCAGIQLNQYNIGETAVQTANALLNGEEPTAQYLPYHYVAGDSL